MDLAQLLPNSVSDSFRPFLKRQESLLTSIAAQITEPFNPTGGRALRFLTQDLSCLKIVILGQDPYPDPAAATGRSFEAGNLKSWSNPFRQASLKNILRALYALNTGNSPYTPFAAVKRAIETGAFPIAPPDRLFSRWEEQGVLLLNTYLTCAPGKPGSHKALWLPFARELLSFLNAARPGLRWFLWGGEAASFAPLLSDGHLYISRHPMMCSERYPDDFLKNPCFRETAAEIDWLGGGAYNRSNS